MKKQTSKQNKTKQNKKTKKKEKNYYSRQYLSLIESTYLYIYVQYLISLIVN